PELEGPGVEGAGHVPGARDGRPIPLSEERLRLAEEPLLRPGAQEGDDAAEEAGSDSCYTQTADSVTIGRLRLCPGAPGAASGQPVNPSPRPLTHHRDTDRSFRLRSSC